MKNQARTELVCLRADLDRVCNWQNQPLGQILPGAWFVNKLALARGHAHLFTDCLWLLSGQWQGPVVATESVWPAQPLVVIIWPFPGKKKKKVVEPCPNPFLPRPAPFLPIPGSCSRELAFPCHSWTLVRFGRAVSKSLDQWLLY